MRERKADISPNNRQFIILMAAGHHTLVDCISANLWLLLGVLPSGIKTIGISHHTPQK